MIWEVTFGMCIYYEATLQSQSCCWRSHNEAVNRHERYVKFTLSSHHIMVLEVNVLNVFSSIWICLPAVCRWISRYGVFGYYWFLNSACSLFMR